MAAKSYIRGHEVEFIDEKWVSCKTGFAVSEDAPCILCGKLPGYGGIDPCLVSIIKALNEGGIKTVASCCGHGRRPGNIVLANGRELVICRDFETSRIVDKAFPSICK